MADATLAKMPGKSGAAPIPIELAIRGTSVDSAGGVKLIELATDEVRVNVPCRARPGDVIELTVRFEWSKFEYRSLGKVKQCNLTRDADTWSLTCRLDMPFPEERIAELAAHGHIERRTWRRENAALEIKVQRELGRAELPGEVLNICPGGCKITCPEELDVGERILIHPQGEGNPFSGGRARVVARSKTEAGHTASCTFVGEAPLVALVDKARRSCGFLQPASRWLDISIWVWIALLAIMAVFWIGQLSWLGN